jgi:hypothetical protein
MNLPRRISIWLAAQFLANGLSGVANFFDQLLQFVLHETPGSHVQ